MATAEKHRQRSHRSYKKNKQDFNYFVSIIPKRFFGSISGSPAKTDTKKKRKLGEAKKKRRFGKRGK